MSNSRNEMVFLALDPTAFPTQRQARQVIVPGQKHPANPVLRPRPGQWDGTRCKVYGTVLVDPQDGLFKMWYSGGTDYPDAMRRTEGSRRHVGYAYSEDGVHWHQPALGLVEFNGSRDNNLVNLNAQAPSVFLQPDADPNHRFLMITETGLNTYHNKVLYSPDGVRWTQSEREPIASDTRFGRHEPFSILYDPLDPDPERRWKGYSLLHANQNGYRGRAVGLFFGTDPDRWREYEVQPIMSPFEGMESEIHIAHVSRFYDTYIMLYDAMEPNHHTQTEIALSHDAVHFQRIQNGIKLLANGRPGEPDAGKICVSPRSLFVHEGKIWWYYTMSTDTYQTGPRSLYASPWYRYTGLAQWRQDGFAYLGATSAADTAEIVTRQFQVGAAGLGDLWLNAVAPPSSGGITVDLLNANGQVLATARPWVGDNLRGAVEWAAPLPAPDATVALRLRFAGVATQVYAMGIHGLSDPHPPTLSPTRGEGVTKASGSPSPVVAEGAGGMGVPVVRWTFKAQAKISGSVAVDEESVYFGSWDQHLYAVDAKTGELRWKVQTGNAITTAPVVNPGVVYTGSRDGLVYALDTATGTSVWQKPGYDGQHELMRNPNGAWLDAPPAIGAWNCAWNDQPAPQRLYIGCHDRHFHAFDLTSGQEMWRFPTFNWILSRPAIADYTVFFGSLDGHIYALDARSGALRWRYRVGSYLKYAPAVARGSVACEAVCGSPLVARETVYCGADDGFLYALDSATGREKWVFQTDKWIWGQPLLADDMLVVASADGRVYGLDPASGKPIWRRATENANYADVVAWRDLALVACTSGRLYAIVPHTGEVAWTFQADAGLRAAPGVGPDDTIYLPTCAGTVYAITR